MKKIHLRIFILFCLVIFMYLFRVFFFQAAPEYLPDLKADTAVYDFCGLIDHASIQKIEDSARKLREEAKVFLYVITIESTGKIKPDIFTEEIIENIRSDGHKVLIFFAKQEEIITIKYDIGLEYILTQKICSDIIDEMIIKNLKKADEEITTRIESGLAVSINENPLIGKAFTDSVAAVDDIIRKNQLKASGFQDIPGEIPREKPRRKNGFPVYKVIIGGIVAGIFMLVVFLRIRRMHCPKCRSLLEITSRMIQEVTNTRHGLREDTFRCLNCGYTRRQKQIIFPRKYKAAIGNKLTNDQI